MLLLLFFSLSAHGPIAGFADTEKSIFLSAMVYKGSPNPGKAVQEKYIVWREFCISTDLPEQQCTSHAPSPRPAIHPRRGHRPEHALLQGRTSLSIPGPGLASARNLRGHSGRFKATGCIIPCQVLVWFPHTVQHWKHSGRVWQLLFNGGVQKIATWFTQDVNWVRTHLKYLYTPKLQVCFTSSSWHSAISILHGDVPSHNMSIFQEIHHHPTKPWWQSEVLVKDRGTKSLPEIIK